MDQKTQLNNETIIESPARKHSLAEDVFAIAVGTVLVSFGVFLYRDASLVMGGVAGISLILDYLTPLNFGVLFFAVNLPFYLFGVGNLGWPYIVRTFCAVALMSVLVRTWPTVVNISDIHPFAASVAGGTMIGLGLLALFRHGAGLGGINIMVAWLQSRFGLRAGFVQLGVDLCILAIGAFVIPPDKLVWSVIGAVLFNMVLGVNHKPGRYMAFS